MGTSVVQLIVTDRDATHNGPPFAFTIINGNEGGVFEVNQQGALLVVEELKRKTKENYLLNVQVLWERMERQSMVLVGHFLSF